MGVNGAALTSSIAYTVGAILMLSIYLRTTGERLRQVLIVSREDLRLVGGLMRRLSSAS